MRIVEVDPQHGVDLGEFSMLAQDVLRVGALQASEQQRPVFLMLENHLDDATAETAVGVIQ